MKKSLWLVFLLMTVLFVLSASIMSQEQPTAKILYPLNLRVSPSVNAEKILVLKRGEIYPVLTRTISSYWLELEVNGTKGWVCGKTYAKTSVQVADIPVNPTVVDEDCRGNSLVPSVTIVSVPRYGDKKGYLVGKTTNIDNTKYVAACFLFVEGRWWPKPSFAKMTVPIDRRGNFTCDVVTGPSPAGRDDFAVKYAVYIIPKSVIPPKEVGSSIPAEITSVAIASDFRDRPPTP